MSVNIIFHVTTACNFDCSYCDVIKDKRFISQETREDFLGFLQNNAKNIGRCKFFGGEPLLNFKEIKNIIDHSFEYIGKNYEIVTNTSLLRDEIGVYFESYFSHIFFSIDSENEFHFQKVISFVEKYKLEKKLHFNLVVSPGKHEYALQQFWKLYESGMRGFKILPVYFTQAWSAGDLKGFSQMMKDILGQMGKDEALRLYGFQENLGEKASLSNNTLFIDVDGGVYFSDMISTYLGEKLKEKLCLGRAKDFQIADFLQTSPEKYEKHISQMQEDNYDNVGGQRQLHQLMDYFSQYLNTR